MERIIEIAAGVFPVFGLLITGYFFRRHQFLSPHTVGQLKSLVVNLALPAILFLAFFSVSISPGGLMIVLLLFSSCSIMLAAGFLVGRRIWKGRRTVPYLFSGFEAGMLGYALFLPIFGSGHLGVFAITDLGQVVFVFLVLVPLLMRGSGEKSSIGKTLANALRSPVIIAIFSGLLLGILNRRFPFESSGFFRAFRALLETAGGLTVPLICISIGYGLEIDRRRFGAAIGICLSRLAANAVLAGILTFLVLRGIVPVPRIYLAAIWTMFILPPPFVIPVFLRQDEEEENAFSSAILSTHTILTVLLMPLVAFFTV
jgi:malate permease and related proteins